MKCGHGCDLCGQGLCTTCGDIHLERCTYCGLQLCLSCRSESICESCKHSFWEKQREIKQQQHRLEETRLKMNEKEVAYAKEMIELKARESELEFNGSARESELEFNGAA